MSTHNLAWLADLHLNFLDDTGIRAFLRTVSDANPDVVLIGGADYSTPAIQRLFEVG